MSVTTGKSTDASAIRPFTIEVPEEALEDLRARIAATRWPEKETVDDASQGVQLATMQALARYWETEYDWRKCEAKLNSVPNFITEIDGLDIHFVHARSKHEDALPVVVCHGWPGSVIEQMKIVDLLTDPTAHGASASDAFHVVIPNMPGYGFSGKPTEPGWDAARIGRAWVELMKRLGYTQFVAAGGDWGGIVVDVMAAGPDAPAELIGIHSTFPGVFPAAIEKAIQTHGELPSDLSAAERRAVETLTSAYGYAGQAEMAWHPQTLFGLADSPVALAAWLIDHDPISYETLIAPAFVEGREGGLTRDDILDNTTMFWLTNTGVSASRIYWEHKASWAAVRNVTAPVAVSVFPEDVVYSPRSWAEQAYPNLVHYNEVDRGGHFAAWEQPELYASELRAGLRSLR
jgi:pimeloyl-ACP methyl ester carboxylesterase